jgi:hypothetical protein
MGADERRALARAEGERPFDFARGSLLRAVLLREAPEIHVLLLTIHHLVADGWSMQVLVQEVAALYAAFAEGRPSPLPELPVQYADYALWQRDHLRGEVLEDEIAFWRRRLAGAPTVVEVPADLARPAVWDPRGGARTRVLSPELTRTVRTLTRAEGATPFMVAAACIAVQVHAYTGRAELLIGTNAANRHHPGTERLIGLFINQVVLRVRPAPEAALRDLVRQVRQDALEAVAHQELPFEKVVEAVSPARDPSRHPLFQVKVDYQDGSAAAGVELPGLALEPVAAEAEPARCDLHLVVSTQGESLLAKLIYPVELFHPDTIDRMLLHFEVLMARFASDPGCPVREAAEALREVDRREAQARREEAKRASLASLHSRERVSVQSPTSQGPSR